MSASSQKTSWSEDFVRSLVTEIKRNPNNQLPEASKKLTVDELTAKILRDAELLKSGVSVDAISKGYERELSEL